MKAAGENVAHQTYTVCNYVLLTFGSILLSAKFGREIHRKISRAISQLQVNYMETQLRASTDVSVLAG